MDYYISVNFSISLFIHDILVVIGENPATLLSCLKTPVWNQYVILTVSYDRCIETWNLTKDLTKLRTVQYTPRKLCLELIERWKKEKKKEKSSHKTMKWFWKINKQLNDIVCFITSLKRLLTCFVCFASPMRSNLSVFFSVFFCVYLF